jgi:hypothetical protein
MYYCYIDESGNTEVINAPTDNVQPTVVMAGIIVEASKLPRLTSDFIEIKRKYYPNKFLKIKHDLEALLLEIKGSDIRTDIRDKRNKLDKKVQHHFHFLDAIFSLLKSNEMKIISRIWVKGFKRPLLDESVYTITTQQFGVRFQKFLEAKGSEGVIVADFREPKQNSYVAHSVFTQKYKKTGDAYPSIVEIPTFGISNNHAVLQICDLICSAVISPIASVRFCNGVIQNPHTSANYQWIQERYSKRLRALQHHCTVGPQNQMYWGITVDNQHNQNNRTFF